MKVVQITTDDRDALQDYEKPAPFFGAAPTALLEGFAGMEHSVEIHVISCVRKPIPFPQKLAGNIYYHQVVVPGGYRRTFFAEAVAKVQRVVRDIDPDIVHGQGTEEYAGICSAFSRYPNCITVHGNMRQIARKLHYKPVLQMTITALMERIALRKTQAVFCNSRYTDWCVGRLNRIKPRVFNAVRSSFFDIKPTPVGDETLLCAGNILPYKNQIALMRALDDLPGIERIKLVFTGACYPEHEYTKQFFREISTRKWCEYAGKSDLASLQGLLGKCSGVIHPALEESFGLVVAEAQAAGVPVAASNIGGLADLIDHGKTGLLFDPYNPSDIREKTMQLLNSSIAENLADNARAFARREYSSRIIADRHIDIYNEILESSS